MYGPPSQTQALGDLLQLVAFRHRPWGPLRSTSSSSTSCRTVLRSFFRASRTRRPLERSHRDCTTASSPASNASRKRETDCSGDMGLSSRDGTQSKARLDSTAPEADYKE